MEVFENFLGDRLHRQAKEGLLRTLKVGDENLIDFTSNDYLGLARSVELFREIEKRMHDAPAKKNGATGSRLLSGNSAYIQHVESKLASIFLGSSALIFNAGYTANLAVLSSIPQRGDTILYDELAHACIKDGARLSLANRYRFKHNDIDDLEKKLRIAVGKKYIAVESIYSMDGDEAPLKELVEVASAYDAILILDEAHGTGVYGSNGNGLACHIKLQEKIPVRIYTFGKAMGVHGACVVGSKALTDYLVNYARPFIYTTALPQHSITSIEVAFDFLRDNIDRQVKLQENVSLFLSQTSQRVNRTNSKSAIQTIIVPGNDNVRRAAQHLQNNRLDVRPILSPTVPKGSERLRICLHSYNTSEEILLLTTVINELTSL